MGPRAAFRGEEGLLVRGGVAGVVLDWRLEIGSWAGGPNAKLVLAVLSQRRW